ncbi:pyridoxal phosphate-dependent aminotransferase [Spirillospora sp. CA-294931]|uniref:pyridoxal phosphate-dependent aminotransferase n=1 Tax=Spirillospora sp. CA-294931 TaxID=3240042 RepID=UPI003D8BA613
MREALAALLADESVPMAMPDAALLRDYLGEGCPQGDPICLSFGETWYQVAPGLAGCLEPVEPHAHGYQLSMYGLPGLRRAARERMLQDHGLGGDEGFDLAVTWAGTRSVMFDFGRFLLDEHPEDDRTPVVVVAGPSWDYDGVLAPLGYRLRYFELRPENGFEPDPREFARLVGDVEGAEDERLALVVLNPQHNPTAVNWSEEFVTGAIRAAVGRGAGLLIDDAYFAVHNPGVTPTSALRILLDELRGMPYGHWLAVRSLGKQFHCNGWGLGTMIAEPDVLATLVNRYRLHNSLMYGGTQQRAMARWLESPESEAFLRRQQVSYGEKRKLVGEFLRGRLGYPADKVHEGECSSYMLFAVPEAYAEEGKAAELFREDCFTRTGVLLAPAWPWPYKGDAAPLPWMRMFLGPDADHLNTALNRLEAAGLTFGRGLAAGKG